MPLQLLHDTSLAAAEDDSKTLSRTRAPTRDVYTEQIIAGEMRSRSCWFRRFDGWRATVGATGAVAGAVPLSSLHLVRGPGGMRPFVAGSAADGFEASHAARAQFVFASSCLLKRPGPLMKRRHHMSFG